MAGTPQAILEHTSSTTWQNCWLNGEKVGEFALDAARAGEHGVPVIMTSGDDKLCAEAKALIDNLETVQVKAGLHLEGGTLLSKTIAHKKIREGAERAVKNCLNVQPLIISSPITIRLELIERTPVPSYPQGVKIIDGRTCEATNRNVEDAIKLLDL